MVSLLFIRARNSKYCSCDEGAEYDQPETALALGVRGAVALASDEIEHGERNVAVEVSIEREDGTEILRSVVALSVSSLMPLDHSSNSRVGSHRRSELGS